jgi:hypothetical protein
LGCLTETLTYYTKLDPSSRIGMLILNSHFISQSSPDIKKKNLNRQRMALNPSATHRDLVKMAFKAFSNREEA